MKRRTQMLITTLLLATLFFFSPLQAHPQQRVAAQSLDNAYVHQAAAENIYIAQLTLGDDSGADAANAHSAAWFNDSANWGTGDGQIGPGTTVRLCGVISTGLNIQGSGTEDQPITILFEPDARLSAPVWETIAWFRTAMRTSSVTHIVIDGGSNGVIESTDNGTGRTYQENQIGIWLYDCHHCEVKNVAIHGIYIRTPRSDDDGSGVGILASGGNHVQIHHTLITEAETGIDYTYPGGGLTEDVKIYNNQIARISNGITAGSGNTDALADDFEIYANDISDAFVWDGIRQSDGHWFHSDGIQIWAVHSGSHFTNLRIHGNTVHGDLGTHITAWIYVEGNVERPLIFNNILVNTGDSFPANGMITASGEIYENTIAMFNPGNCINAGPDSRIKNNLLYNCAAAIGIHEPGGQTGIDFNLFSGDPDFATVDSNGTFHFLTFTEWQAAGFDLHSQIADPQFVNPASYDFHLSPASPAINAGTVLSDPVAFDKEGRTRPQGGGWDIGAYEFAPDLELGGVPADRAIRLNWTVNATLPATATWMIAYQNPGSAYLPVTGILSPTRAYTLTNLTNGVWYTVTLSAMLDGAPWLSDTVVVMPTGIRVYLPLVLR